MTCLPLQYIRVDAYIHEGLETWFCSGAPLSLTHHVSLVSSESSRLMRAWAEASVVNVFHGSSLCKRVGHEAHSDSIACCLSLDTLRFSYHGSSQWSRASLAVLIARDGAMDALALASQRAAAAERELQESFRAAFLREDDERYLDTPWRL